MSEDLSLTLEALALPLSSWRHHAMPPRCPAERNAYLVAPFLSPPIATLALIVSPRHFCALSRDSRAVLGCI